MKKIFSLAMAVCASAMLFAGDIYKADFTKGKESWTIEDKTLPSGLTFIWTTNSQYGAKATAFYKQAYAGESWFVSPAIDLTAAKTATLKLNQAVNKGAATNLKVKVSTDNGTTWNDITIGMPAGTSWTFQDDEAVIDAYAGKTIKMAFVYVSTTSVCPTWEVKTVTIYEGEATPAEEITVTKALEIGSALAEGATSDNEYRVVGFARGAKEYDTQYNSQTFYMTDDMSVKGEFYAFQTRISEIADGYKVAVTGKIMKYVYTDEDGNVTGTSIQIKQGKGEIISTATAVEDVQVDATKAIKVVENGQLVIIRDGVRYNAVGAVIE